ncbi:hypothetical protein [Rathayibacter iranicus]|uniref:DUF4352 domain-containing protein n=2 Tax=Rathayibacter iranicus TaxID=59737 RepID=A0AAD1ENG1_9MICO|nr:hypothetical protein [Rathayibacter iranicus]AZZ56685.1 hypothetical protein C7V51_12955 [Rathayibacter iranicus]MWV31279.1 hypothetical protein [Rathayibacter iranicus NCPPB 2253 = VKM Ac-1602]PPI43330.1 hypothetical protein C5E09_11875 [Rathayibacter iranicus]PPI58273.1 hypothetical protein C5E08_12790 [Rathayibacter iranicus]PPI69388.1 hypothetical protein C5E01_11835 [Rathayibacter iranicus]
MTETQPSAPPVPPFSGSHAAPPAPPARSGLAITALIIGIAAVPLAFVPILGGPLAIAAIVLGIVTLAKRKPPKSFGVTGLVLGVVGVVLTIVIIVITAIGIVNAVRDRQLQGLTHSSDSSPSARPADQKLIAKFNDGIIYDDKVAVGVAEPTTFQPGERATGADQAHQVVLTFAIKNDSDKAFDPQLRVNVSSGGVEASRIYDYSSTEKFEEPRTSVLPGGSVTWRQAFSVADPKSLVVEIAADFDRPKAIFTNTQ